MNTKSLFIIILPLFFSCAVSQPALNITGEKTAIERHIIGEYNEIEKDAWIISSVDTDIRKGGGMFAAVGDEELLTAMRIREFHRDRIREYKDRHAIGEGNDGFISYRKTDKYENNKEMKNTLLTLIQEENKARQTIFIRSLVKEGVKEPDQEKIREFGMFFAEEQRSSALKNDWIQNKSGEWIRKK